MSYFRPMGDGPITDPAEVDLTIATVPPTRVACSELPADSPWRGPGQVCADPSPGTTLLDTVKSLVGGAAVGPVGPAAEGTTTIDLLRVAGLVAIGVVVYRQVTKKRRA